MSYVTGIRVALVGRGIRIALLATFASATLETLSAQATHAHPPASTSRTPASAARLTQDQRITRAREYARRTIAADRIPGMTAAVAIDGKVVWAEGFGFADLENQVPMTAESRIRIASISKAVTAAAVGLLHEQGKLDLDAPIQRYVPTFPEKPWPITTRQVAGHVAGIRHYRDGEFESMKPYPTVTQALDIFKNDSLMFQPGARYLYSTYGWNLISAVVEGAAGEPFVTYMRRQVFEPLGMKSTTPEYVDSIIPKRVHYYMRDSAGPMRNAPYVDNSNKWAGGGFLSTPRDLVIFGSALLKPGFLKQETIDLLWTPQRTADGKSTNYGIGWTSVTDSTGRRVVSHSGGAMAANSLLLIYPKERVVVAVVTNTNSRFAGAGAREIARIFLER